MNPSNFPLAHLQSWMQQAITTPGVLPTDINAIILPSRNQTAEQRLQIYTHAYHARLLDCLAEEFATLKSVIGEQAFTELASGYLLAHPPTSYTLNDLGRHFPTFLQQTRPSRESEGDDEIDFLIELATLERTYSEVFDGHGMENSPSLSADQLLALPLEQWLHARLIPAPSLRFLALKFPAHEFITARRTDPATPIPNPSPTCLLITRRDYIVRRIPLPREEFQLLQDLCTHNTIGEALAAATQRSPHPDRLLPQIQHWFTTWTQANYFTTLES